MKTKNFLVVLALMIAGLTITSCNKLKQPDTSFTEDFAYAENVFNEMANIADEGYEKGASGLKSGDGSSVILSDCAEVTIDFSEKPYRLEVDFGEENCLCNDDRYRRGKIIVTFDGMYREPGTTIKHFTENFYVDDNQVEGSTTVVNKGENNSGNVYFEIEETGTIQKEGDGTITWNSSRVREWLEGNSTLSVWDDIYLIDGTANGLTSTNESWEMQILQSLRIELGCRWIPSGSISIDIQDIPTILLDYGNGSCDRNATAEIDGKIYNIVMK